MKKSKAPKIQYGRSFRYGSPEAAIKDLTRFAKKQAEQCGQCRRGDHTAHTDDGRCANDNTFNADCKCPAGGGR